MKAVVSLIVGVLTFLGCAPPSAMAASIDPPPFAQRIGAATLGPFTLGEVNEDNVLSAVKFLDAAKERGDKSVLMYINSPGGSVFDGLELARHIEGLGIPVNCHVTGLAASMAFYLLESCSKRTMDRRAILMAHEPSVSGTVSGNETRFGNIAAQLHAITEVLVNQSVRRLKMTPAEFHAKIDGGREWWINADEAIAVGAVDG